MNTYRVDITYERTVSFYVEAESNVHPRLFLDKYPDFDPRDIPGLVDEVSDEMEMDCNCTPSDGVTANFRVTNDLELLGVDE